MSDRPLTPFQQALVDGFSEPATKGEVFAVRYALAGLVGLLHYAGAMDGWSFVRFCLNQAEDGHVVGDRDVLRQQAKLTAELLQTPSEAARSALKVVEGGAGD